MYTDIPCLVTGPLSPVLEVRKRRPKLGKMSVVDCGQHVHCRSVPRPEQLCHYFWVGDPSVVFG